MFYDSATFPQEAMSRGRIPNAYSTPVLYPSPFFDLGHTYLPKTVQDLFRWCKYYFLTNSVIHAIITKLATYPITEISIEEENDALREKWDDFLHKDLKIRQFQVSAGLDYHAFGNCLISISFPFQKFLGCPACGRYEDIRNATYKYRGFEFYIHCQRCGYHGKSDPLDHYIKAPERIKLMRWNLENVEIEPGRMGADPIYHVNLSSALYNDMVVGRKEIVAQMPQIFLKAAKERKSVALNSSEVYHMRRSSISSDYEGWGVPRIMAILKDAFLCQLMKKATEQLLAEHIVPLRVLFPTAIGPAIDPYEYANLARWKENINREIDYWRIDPNRIPVLNIPLGSMTLGGDGKALLLIQDIQVMYELLAVGMGVPREFLFGGLSFSGSSVSLRMLENDFLRYMEDQHGFLNWVIRKTGDYMGWSTVEAKHKPFKMADDLNRLGMAMQMRQLGDLSRHDLHVQAGFDPDVTAKMLEKERALTREETRAQARAQAEAQGELMLIQTRYQIKAQELQQKMQQEAAASQENPDVAQNLQGGQGLQINPNMLGPGGNPAETVGYDLRNLASDTVNMIRANPQTAKEILPRLQAEYPEVHRQVMNLLSPPAPVQPLPEQRPPRREAESALI